MIKRMTLLKMIPVILLLSLSFSTSYAALVCCKQHSGVKRCDHVKGFELCRDGHYAKECPCGNYSILKSMNQLSLIV